MYIILVFIYAQGEKNKIYIELITSVDCFKLSVRIQITHCLYILTAE